LTPYTTHAYTLSLHDALPISYRFDESWNEPNNAKLAEKIGYVFQCPADPGEDLHTNYVLVTGPDAVFHDDQTIKLSDIENGDGLDRKSTRLNSSHVSISYAVF